MPSKLCFQVDYAFIPRMWVQSETNSKQHNFRSSSRSFNSRLRNSTKGYIRHHRHHRTDTSHSNSQANPRAVAPLHFAVSLLSFICIQAEACGSQTAVLNKIHFKPCFRRRRAFQVAQPALLECITAIWYIKKSAKQFVCLIFHFIIIPCSAFPLLPWGTVG